MLTPLGQRTVLLLELLELLSGTTGRLPETAGIGALAMPQAADDAPHLLLTIANGALQLLALPSPINGLMPAKTERMSPTPAGCAR